MKQTFFFIFAFALYNFNITNDLSAGINSAKADMADCLPGCANMEVITVTAAGPSFWTSTAYVSTPSPNDLTSFSMFDVAESMSNEVASVQEDIAANKLDVEMAQDFITAALAIKNEIHKILNNASISRFLPESEKAALRAMVDRINKALDKATKYIQFANLGEQALAHQLGGETLLAINELVAYGVGELVERLVRFPIVAQIAGAVTAYAVEGALDFIVQNMTNQFNYIEQNKYSSLVSYYPNYVYDYSYSSIPSNCNLCQEP